MTHTNLRAEGQTLLELVIAIGVVAIVVTGLVVAATSSLRYGQESRTRTLAVSYAQEGLELARQIRDTQSSAAFIAYSGSGTKDWCLNQADAWAQDDGSGCGPIVSGSPYTRTVTFTWDGTTMTVLSSVSWVLGGTQASTQLKTYLTLWR